MEIRNGTLLEYPSYSTFFLVHDITVLNARLTSLNSDIYNNQSISLASLFQSIQSKYFIILSY